MATGSFYGKSPLLNTNIISGYIYNMIISQQVFSDNIKGTYSNLARKFKTDATMYGDTKIWYSTDAGETTEWNNDAEAANLLALNRPNNPMMQYITLDQFRKTWVTTDMYLSKAAWSDEGSFAAYTAVVLGWMSTTKNIYESKLINTFVGTTEVPTTAGVLTTTYIPKKGATPVTYNLYAPKGTINVDITTAKSNASTQEEANRLEAGVIAETIADLIVDLKDVKRDYNQYRFLRSYDPNEFTFVWNAAYVNKIKKLDLPTMFHKDGLIDKFEEEILPKEYFGTVITSSNASSFSDSTPAAGKPIDSDNGQYTPGSNNANGCIRSLVEKTVTVSGTDYHVFPGDEIPAGATIGASSTNFIYGEVYIEKSDVICKVIENGAVPFLSSFQTSTEFFNPRSLTTNHYLIWGFASPEVLFDKAFITVKAI